MEKSAILTKGVVFLIDDDVAVRRGVDALLAAADYESITFESAEAFLKNLSELNLSNAAMLVDVCMPGIQGLELQERLKKEDVKIPVIVMTAHGDISMAVRAMRNGAIDFLQKPFTAEELVTALDRALSAPTVLAEKAELAASPILLKGYQSLTPRESEVFRVLVKGATNKKIARVLSISPRTVEVHRKKIMSKMNAGCFAELVRMAVALNIDDAT